MNTYKIFIVQDDDDTSREVETFTAYSTSASAVKDILQHTDIEFQYNDKYIVIFEASDEGYMYEIWESKGQYENDDILDPLDGGQCTSTLSNAIEMALSQA